MWIHGVCPLHVFRDKCKSALHCTALLIIAAAAAGRAGADRSFVTFILEPLYKLTSAVVGEHPKTIERLLGDEFGIHLKSSAYSQDVKPLLKEVRRAALFCSSPSQHSWILQ
jgi:hypothetical protein